MGIEIRETYGNSSSEHSHTHQWDAIRNTTNREVESTKRLLGPRKVNALLTSKTAIEFDLLEAKEEILNVLKKSQEKTFKTIETLYNGGTRPENIIMENGKIVTRPEQIRPEDKAIQKRLNDLKQTGLSKLYYTELKDLWGKSITDAVNHASSQQLDALVDLTVYYLTQSKKKALTTPDNKLPDLWHRVRDIYDRQRKYRESDQTNKEDATALMRYTEKYSDLKTFKITFRGSIKQLRNMLWYSLASTRNLKEKAAIAAKQEPQRLAHLQEKAAIAAKQEEQKQAHLQEKYGWGKPHHPLEQDQEIDLKGKRGKEQRRLRFIVDQREEQQRIFDDDDIKAVQKSFSLKNCAIKVDSFLSELAKNPQYQTSTNATKLIYLTSSMLGYFQDMRSEILTMKMSSEVRKSTSEILSEVKAAEGRLGKRVKKYGSGQARSWLNDISSDGGAAWSVVTTTGSIAGTLAAGGAMF